jgi:hypothetical protein
MTYLWIGLSILAFLAVGLLGLRWMDVRRDEAAWQRLVRQASATSGTYDPRMIEGLPEPAQRYFNFSILPGSPVVSVVELEMTGELGLGSPNDPKFSKMTARQVLAPPHGLVWRVQVGAISGSDGVTSTSSWTKFWLYGLIPVVRVSNNEDHRRSAFGRVVAEGAFWTPAMLLPGDNVRWEQVDENTARAIVSINGFEQNVDVTVAHDGQPTHVVISRWSNENPDRVYRLQPFGGYLDDFRRFDGYLLPTSVEGGNHFCTDDYFPFYKARISEIRLDLVGLTGDPQEQ